MADQRQEARSFIRPLAKDDRNTAEQLVGQGFMEGVAVANKRMYMRPTTVMAVVVLGLVVDFLMGIHKSAFDGPFLNYVQLAIGPCIVILPILGLVEWWQRPAFDDRLRLLVGGWDMIRPLDYYTSPGGAWVFEHAVKTKNGGSDMIIGVVMLDAHSPGVEVTSVLEKREEGELKSNRLANAMGKIDDNMLRQRKKAPKGNTAEVRHVDVDIPYRRNGVGTELVGQALDSAFGLAPGEKSVNISKSTGITRVIAMASPFTPGGDQFWAKLGFHVLAPGELEADWRKEEPVGIEKWQGHWMGVSREAWIAAREQLYEKSA